jgi:transcriptional regulator with XRE-family HTH domain
MKDFYTLSDVQLVKRIGNKLKAVRLKRNITQQSLAEASSISLSSLKKIESGEIGTFDSLLRVLRTLGMLESIATLFEEEQMSPSEYYDMVNKSLRDQKHLISIGN